MFGEFLAWWSEQMLQWIPPGLRGRERAGAHALIVAAHTDATGAFATVSLTVRRQQRDRGLGSFAMDEHGLHAMRNAASSGGRPPATVLRLPGELLLERDVSLPLAAERDRERVLSYEMDRLTPFAAPEVFWSHDVERRDRARGKLQLRLFLVAKAAIAPLLEALARAGLTPTVLEVEAPGGAARLIALEHTASGRERLLRRATAAAAIACGVLAAIAVALPFVAQSLAADRVERRIEALKPRVAEAEAVRRQIAAKNAGVDVVAAERARDGDTLAVLAAVTELLPDDTYLTDLTLRQGKLTINGRSASAVRLIGALSADPLIREPDFAAPVTRIENGRGDLFAIRATVAN
jgi:general secretion pathway protein L